MPRESELGEMLRGMRVAAGLSQEELADRAGLSADAIASLERGRRRYPRASTVAALALAGLTVIVTALSDVFGRGVHQPPGRQLRACLLGRRQSLAIARQGTPRCHLPASCPLRDRPALTA